MWTELLFKNKENTTLLGVNNKSVVEIAFTYHLISDTHPEVFLLNFFPSREEFEKSEEKLINQSYMSVCHVRQINTITH